MTAPRHRGVVDISGPASTASTINSMHERACKSALDALESARVCGDLLIEAKARFPHGVWSKWLTENITFSERTAQRYMKLAAGWESLKTKTDTAVSDLTVGAAIRLLTPPRPPTNQSSATPTAKEPPSHSPNELEIMIEQLKEDNANLAEAAALAQELQDKVTAYEATEPDEQQREILVLQKQIVGLKAEVQRLTCARSDLQTKCNELIREVKRLRKAA